MKQHDAKRILVLGMLTALLGYPTPSTAAGQVADDDELSSVVESPEDRIEPLRPRLSPRNGIQSSVSAGRIIDLDAWPRPVPPPVQAGAGIVRVPDPAGL